MSAIHVMLFSELTAGKFPLYRPAERGATRKDLVQPPSIGLSAIIRGRGVTTGKAIPIG